MRSTTFIAIASAFMMAAPLSAQQDAGKQTAVLECLRKNVLFGDIVIESDERSYRFSIPVTNNLPHAISAFNLDLVLRAKGRSVPIKRDSGRVEIPGGIEPGETLIQRYYVRKDHRGEFSDLMAEVVLTNVFDEESYRVIDDGLRYTGSDAVQKNTISPRGCQ